MESRIRVCISHLKEVEALLVKLQTSTLSGSSEATEIATSLNLIRKALDAVCETQNRVNRLRSKRSPAGSST